MEAGTDLPRPSYNIAPTQEALAIINDGRGARMAPLRWGWQERTRGGQPRQIINARSESLSGGSWTFGWSVQNARCLVPANGYYEWKALAGSKQPWYFTSKSQAAFCFAGLYRDDSFVILTGPPGDERTRRVHERVPCIIPAEHCGRWIDPGFSPEAALTIPRAFGSAVVDLACWPVSKSVGSVARDSYDLLAAVPEDRTLFG